MSVGPAPWWRTAVVYQVYLRSFADGDGDGIGDLTGLRAHLDHLVSLGVDALWINPWYPSPMADGGYDVVDYCDIEPLFGTLEQARGLVRDAHAVGLRVLSDVVPNHTSSEHPWFRAALAAAEGSPERELYHFRDGRGEDGGLPPNDWISAFGGTAWTRVPRPDGSPGQWYLHLFAPEQPDLNWDHPDVRGFFEKVLRFWFDLGIDGMRVDAAAALAKAPGLPDHGFLPGEIFQPATWTASPLWDVDAVHEIYRSWRSVGDSYPGERVFVGEVPVNGPQRLARYVRPGELHTAITLEFIQTPWREDALRRTIDTTVAALADVGAPPVWALGSHDEMRQVTRLGGGDVELGTRRARAALLLMLALPGGAYLFQGEELGLWEVEDLDPGVVQDPIVHRSGGTMRGRDGCRVPLPWAGSAPPFGFTAGPEQPWLPQPPSWAHLTAEAESGDPASVLTLYRTALHLRRRLVAGLPDGPAGERLRWLPSPPGVLAFERGDAWRCVVNTSSEALPWAVTGSGSDAGTLLSSGPLTDGLLPGDTAVWLAPSAAGHSFG